MNRVIDWIKDLWFYKKEEPTEIKFIKTESGHYKYVYQYFKLSKKYISYMIETETGRVLSTSEYRGISQKVFDTIVENKKNASKINNLIGEITVQHIYK